MKWIANVELDLPSSTTKTDLTKATGIDTANLALKSNLAAKVKAEVDKVDVDKLKSALVDKSKLSDVVNNEMVKRNVYDKLLAKVNEIDTIGFILKTEYDTDKLSLEKKKPKLSGLVEKTDYNAKITELESKILGISGLATTIALTAVENKISGVNNLIKKTDYDAKILDIESKYFATADYQKVTSETLEAKIKQKRLVDKPAIAGFINNTAKLN